MFRRFGDRLKVELKQIVDRRLDASALASGSNLKVFISICIPTFECLILEISLLVLKSMLFLTSDRGELSCIQWRTLIFLKHCSLSDMLCGLVDLCWHRS